MAHGGALAVGSWQSSRGAGEAAAPSAPSCMLVAPAAGRSKSLPKNLVNKYRSGSFLFLFY